MELARDARVFDHFRGAFGRAADVPAAVQVGERRPLRLVRTKPRNTR